MMDKMHLIFEQHTLSVAICWYVQHYSLTYPEKVTVQVTLTLYNITTYSSTFIPAFHNYNLLRILKVNFLLCQE